LEPLLLAIVAEKTGYPVDMLQLDMDLEGDLGIDSIKRVEILAAVDERAPHLPKVDRARLSALHTLREIVDYLNVGAASAAIPDAAAHHAIAAHAAPAFENLGRYALELIPAPATGFAMRGLLSGTHIHVTGDDTIAEALAETLRQRGVHATAVAELPADANACIYLGGLRAVASVDAAIAVNHEAFRIARILAAHLQSAPGLFVTVQDSGGSFGLQAGDAQREWMSGMPALIKTCALEWPQASVKAIDLPRLNRKPEVLAELIADELLLGGGEIEVALPSVGVRSTLRSVACAVDAAEPVIERNDVVLVSGGARGVTAACLQEWAGRSHARFVLIGRTPLRSEPACCVGISDEAGLKRALLAAAQTAGKALTPATLLAGVQQVQAQREIRQTLAALAAAGSEVRYCDINIDDGAALAKALDEVRTAWGPIRGVVHAAGVLADKRIAEKTDAQFARVFDTKVQGLRTLLAATANDPLKLLCVFSSVSARCGNTGQSDYAMANEVLAKVAAAEARRRPGMRVKSLGWGPWEGGMVTPQLKERFAALGVPMIPLTAGAHMFADEMCDAGKDGVELVLGGAPRAEALLFDGADLRVDALELRVQRGSHAYLEGHAVDGMPVVPVVLVAEWLARAARSFRPGLALAALHELKVLKGIRLGGFENGGDLFRIEASPLQSPDATLLQMSVRDAAGRMRYSARAELRAIAAVSTQGLPSLALDAWPGASPYPELLFHRGHFEVIEQMQGISDAGISARVRGVNAAAWPNQDWQLDVAALDGGMQLAVLYGQRMLGAQNLPTSIDTVRRFATDACNGPITATAYRRNVGKSATTTDIHFVDANGQHFAELLGVHNHALAQA
jgi:NAD(P)-dependent dehydrogenase (short-subunit alcohol dehydrogenase family)/acyl carrier protein